MLGTLQANWRHKWKESIRKALTQRDIPMQPNDKFWRKAKKKKNVDNVAQEINIVLHTTRLNIKYEIKFWIEDEDWTKNFINTYNFTKTLYILAASCKNHQKTYSKQKLCTTRSAWRITWVSIKEMLLLDTDKDNDNDLSSYNDLQKSLFNDIMSSFEWKCVVTR